ncbi:MAG: cytochrome c oxidase subunit II [Rhodospirillaceae bacterium]|jgi:cytochrome c oxidase subunit II|nr:cytochrome c oxidase subunit II [Rhodospirillaceae bacterium]
MKLGRFGLKLIPAVLAIFGVSAAWAAQPAPWEMGFQKAATPSMADIVAFNDWLFIVITVIALFVLALMLYVFMRFNARANPTPSKVTHNTLIEVVWTAVPVIILVLIAIPSLKQLYFLNNVANPEMTLKAVGHQWYWTHVYPDYDDYELDSIMLEDDELEPGQPRLLATDTAVVLPAETNIRLLTTADDVIHSWAIPSFGVKLDAVPGRINETWFRIDEPGLYYGQCSELCGVRHGFMPIMIKAVSKSEFDAWIKEQQAARDTNDGDTPVRLAGAAATE